MTYSISYYSDKLSSFFHLSVFVFNNFYRVKIDDKVSTLKYEETVEESTMHLVDDDKDGDDDEDKMFYSPLAINDPSANLQLSPGNKKHCFRLLIQQTMHQMSIVTIYNPTKTLIKNFQKHL